MAYIRKRKGKFSVAIRKKHGQRIYKTFDLKSDALSFAKETELQIQQNRYKDISEASKTTLKIVIQRYVREKIKKQKLIRKRERSKYNVILRNDICNKTLTDLRTSDFAKFRDQRLEIGITNSTINRELSAMRVAIQTSIDEWDCWLPENPVKSSIKLTENPARERRLKAGEYEKLMVACKRNSKFSSPSIYWCPAINWAIETAMRLSEQLSLRWENINVVKRTAFIPAQMTKTKRSRTVALTDKALEVLKKFHAILTAKYFQCL